MRKNTAHCKRWQTRHSFRVTPSVPPALLIGRQVDEEAIEHRGHCQEGVADDGVVPLVALQQCVQLLVVGHAVGNNGLFDGLRKTLPDGRL